MDQPYSGTYRAKALSLNGGALTVLVPQVFGEIAIIVTEFTGVAPDTSEMGWVMFQSGDPEHPVWVSRAASAGPASLDGLEDVDTTTPPTTGQSLIFDGAQWVPGGPISGPKGDTGAQGIQGVPGTPGTAGAPGAPTVLVVTALPGTLVANTLYVVVT